MHRESVIMHFPLAAAVSAENFTKHSIEVYDKSILVVPAALNHKKAEEKLTNYLENGGKIIVYGSEKYLREAKFAKVRVDIYGEMKQLFSAMKQYGYEFEFVGNHDDMKQPSMTLHRSNNAVIFSVYNRDTTGVTRINLPLGMPIINGFNAKISGGCAEYCFDRSVHSECRVFVKQEKGTTSTRGSAG